PPSSIDFYPLSLHDALPIFRAFCGLLSNVRVAVARTHDAVVEGVEPRAEADRLCADVARGIDPARDVGAIGGEPRLRLRKPLDLAAIGAVLDVEQSGDGLIREDDAGVALGRQVEDRVELGRGVVGAADVQAVDGPFAFVVLPEALREGASAVRRRLADDVLAGAVVA